METKRLKELASKVLGKAAVKEEKEKDSFLTVSLKGNSKHIDMYDENDKSFQFPGYGGNQGNRETGPIPLPFLDLDGSLVIPFGCDSRYHYWTGGQSIAETEKEIKRLLH